MPKQVRFAQLVKTSGHPHAATLWVSDPQKDPEFKKAIQENRLVTVHNVNVGAKKDSGQIGFSAARNAAYLLFPKPLAMDKGARVIGLKYEMLQDTPVHDPVKITQAPSRKKIERVKTVNKRA